jgi:DNA polymerase-3 subunit epsilon
MLSIVIKKPICFIDLETTGTSIATDRIVSIAIIKVYPDGKREEKSALVNPEMRIPKEASDVHGITNNMVELKPVFKQLSKSIYAFIQDSDLAGFNSNNFDIPLLAEEFLRCNIDFPSPDTRMIDVMSIFKSKERRNLEAGYKFYCGKEMKNAHDALYDIQVTLEVFEKQLERYPELQQGMDFINDFCQGEKKADLAGKILIDKKGKYVYNCGNVKGAKIEDDIQTNGKKAFAFWMLKKDFPLNTKRVLQKIITELFHPEYKSLANLDEFMSDVEKRQEVQKSFAFKHNPNYNGDEKQI